MSLLLRLAAVLFFGCAALSAIRLAIANTIARDGTTDAISRSTSIEWPTPEAELEQTLAELDPPRELYALQRAIEANPRSSAAWMALGLAEETSNDLTSAEQSLLHAAQVDHQYLPAWTLTNFYFRRTNLKQFWVWADKAEPLNHDDFRPFLQLCDRFEPDPTRLLAHFHKGSTLQPHYLNFLIGENRLDEAQQVARLMAWDRSNDAHLIDLADRQLRAGNANAARELWNTASGFPALNPSADQILTNGDLRRPPLNLVFDWRLKQVDGVTETWRPSELTFTFSGSQPETCGLLEQIIDLGPDRLRLRYDYTSGQDPLTGIHWSLDGAEGTGIEPSSQWKAGAFDLPPSRGLHTLKLFYRREPGTARIQGRFEIRNLRLEAVP